jgi:hypothetical protein
MSKTYTRPTLQAKGTVVQLTEIHTVVPSDGGDPPNDKLFQAGTVGFNL